jgi:phosphoribosylaminoimidazole carboxylase PurE protein
MKGKNVFVGIIMGSKSDLPVMEAACDVLDEYDVGWEIRILSAHRTAEETRDYAISARERKIKVLIAGAGLAAHLAGALAANTDLPVIGVPINSGTLGGIDALLSTVQMPPGVPVGTMAIGKGGAKNAAIFAVKILALYDTGLKAKLAGKIVAMAINTLREGKEALKEFMAKREE